MEAHADPFAALPDDAVGRILEDLGSPADLARAMAVCRAWRDIVLGQRLWWRLCVKLCPEAALLQVVEDESGARATTSSAPDGAGPSSEPPGKGTDAATLGRPPRSFSGASSTTLSMHQLLHAPREEPPPLVAEHLAARMLASGAGAGPGNATASTVDSPGARGGAQPGLPVHQAQGSPVEGAGEAASRAPALAHGRQEGVAHVRTGAAGPSRAWEGAPTDFRSQDYVVWRVVSKLCRSIGKAQALCSAPTRVAVSPRRGSRAEGQFPEHDLLGPELEHRGAHGERQDRAVGGGLAAGTEGPADRSGPPARDDLQAAGGVPEGAARAGSDEAALGDEPVATGAWRRRAAGRPGRAPLAEATPEGYSRTPPQERSEGMESCILAAVEASSTDNYPLEGIEKTLEPQARWPDPFTPSYWSSKGQQDPAVPEALVYRLRTPLCLVTEFAVRPFKAFFQEDLPVYACCYVRLRLGRLVGGGWPPGHASEDEAPGPGAAEEALQDSVAGGWRPRDAGAPAAPQAEGAPGQGGMESEPSWDRVWPRVPGETWEGPDAALPGRTPPAGLHPWGSDAGTAPATSRGRREGKTPRTYEWHYVSPPYALQQEDTLQQFVLPRPVLCMGGVAQIDLIHRLQTQSSDNIYYICVCHVQIQGHVLPQYSARALSPPPLPEATFTVCTAPEENWQCHRCCPEGCVACCGPWSAGSGSAGGLSGSAMAPAGMGAGGARGQHLGRGRSTVSGSCCCIAAASASRSGLTAARPRMLLQYRPHSFLPSPVRTPRVPPAAPLFRYFWRLLGARPAALAAGPLGGRQVDGAMGGEVDETQPAAEGADEEWDEGAGSSTFPEGPQERAHQGTAGPPAWQNRFQSRLIQLLLPGAAPLAGRSRGGLHGSGGDAEEGMPGDREGEAGGREPGTRPGLEGDEGGAWPVFGAQAQGNSLLRAARPEAAHLTPRLPTRDAVEHSLRPRGASTARHSSGISPGEASQEPLGGAPRRGRMVQIGGGHLGAWEGSASEVHDIGRQLLSPELQGGLPGAGASGVGARDSAREDAGGSMGHPATAWGRLRDASGSSRTELGPVGPNSTRAVEALEGEDEDEVFLDALQSQG